MRRRLCAQASAIVLPLVAGAASAQPLPDYGLEWGTVGAPGNAPLMPGPGYNLDHPIGAVSSEFRMARTEITNAQYLEFLVALTTAIPSIPLNPESTGADIVGIRRSWGIEWFLDDSERQRGARMGFNYAAMYCNWLHNDKGSQPSAFLNGAYDASTFYPNPGPQQVIHSPGARFWIPSTDEWTKAMFFDPNKNGPGQPGYWMYPISSDTPPVGGPPGTPGAQTGAGDYEPHDFRFWPVGSYPNAQSPWGILDGSGGAREWCEGAVEGDVEGFFRNVRGTRNEDTVLLTADRIDVERWGEFRDYAAGIRLVGIVPSPGTAIVFSSLLMVTFRRRSTPEAPVPLLLRLRKPASAG